MYLIDTNVISEARKGRRANAGVQAFFWRLPSGEVHSTCPSSPWVSCGVGWISSGIEETISSLGSLMTGSR